LAYGAIKIKNRLADQQKRISNLEEQRQKEQDQQKQLDELQQYKNNQQQQQAEQEQQQAIQAKQASLEQCKENQTKCPNEIKALNDKIAEVKGNINRDEAETKSCDKENGASSCKLGDDNRKGMIADEEAILLKSKTSLSALLNGDCKDYKNPCE